MFVAAAIQPGSGDIYLGAGMVCVCMYWPYVWRLSGRVTPPYLEASFPSWLLLPASQSCLTYPESRGELGEQTFLSRWFRQF